MPRKVYNDRVRYPALGLHLDRHPTLVPKGSLVNGSSGFSIVDGQLRAQRGGINFDDEIADLDGPIRRILSFDRSDGNIFHVVATDTKLYARGASDTSFTNIGPTFSSTEGDEWSFVVFYNATIGNDTKDILIGTNGQERPFYWTGDTVGANETVYFGDTGFKARRLAVYANQLVCGDVEVSGTRKANTLIFSGIGTPTVLNAAEFVVNPEMDGIQALVPLTQNVMVAYGRRAITTVQAVTDARNYVFTHHAGDVGALSGNLIINRGNTHHFLGPGGKYMFDGNRLTTVSDHVYPNVVREAIDLGGLGVSKALHLPSIKAEWWLVPITGEQPAIYVDNEQEQKHPQMPTPVSRFNAPNITALGSVTKGTRVTFDTLTAGWDTYTQRWNEFSTGGFAREIWAGDKDGKIYRASEIQSSGAEQVATLVSSRYHLVPEGNVGRVRKFYFYIEGAQATVKMRFYSGPDTRDSDAEETVVFKSDTRRASFSGAGLFFDFTAEIRSAADWTVNGWTWEATAKGSAT